jgi:hypothetical protein
MTKINYVIATYNGIGKRKHTYPLPEDVLKTHLEKITSLQHSLSQITIMKAKSNNDYKNYYNIEDLIKTFNIPIKIIDCENYGYSMGQWLKAYELFPDFDFYLFMEDDYCGGMDHFDSILLECYNQKFTEHIGLLCSVVEGSSIYKEIGGYPLHFEGCVFISKQTLHKLYTFPKWENNPRKWLDLIDKHIDPYFNWEWQRKGYLGGYYQVTFSHLFTLSNINHEDYLDININHTLIQFPYWGDTNNNNLGGHIDFYNKGSTIKKKYTLEDIHNSPIIPVQLANNDYIKFNTIL